MKIPLVMIPGLVCDDRLFTHQLENLSDIADMQVIDHRHFNDIKDLARSILVGAPAKFALLGLSMGGYVAFEIMRQAPERVIKLALIATSARQDSDEMAKRRRDFIRLAGMGKFRGMSPVLVQSFIHPDNVGNESLISTLYDMAQDTGAEGFINQQQAILSRPDSTETLGHITCPTIVIFGDSDERTPVAVNGEIATAIAGAELVVLPHCGHLPPLEQPELTTKHLRAWLEG